MMEFWYPDWDFYKETHERMIEEFGGHHGYIIYSKEAFEKIIEEVKEKEGLYEKAGILLKKLRTVRLVEDGLRRTAHSITSTFLETNGGFIYEIDLERVILFMNEDLLECTCEQVASWLKNGKI